MCCQELLPTANDEGEPESVIDREQRVQDLARATEAATGWDRDPDCLPHRHV